MDLKHPNIVGTSLMLEGDPRGLNRVLVIETDLPVDGRDPKYKKVTMDEIIEMAGDFLRKNSMIADLVSIRTVQRK
jgi:hypothetical protein